MILMLVQLPPPIHGASLVNQFVCEIITSRYKNTKIIDISTAKIDGKIGKASTQKIIQSLGVFWKFLIELTRRDLKYCYICLHPLGSVFFRDASYCLAAKLFQKKIIIHLHANGIAKYRSPIRRFIYKMVFKNSTVIHLSEIFFKDVEDYVEPKNFYILPNFSLDMESTSPPHQEAIVFYYLSNYIEGKGPLLILNAAKELYSPATLCKFVFAGAWLDPATKNKIDNWVMKNKDLVDSGYIQIHGPVYDQQKKDLINSSSIFLFPSYIDTYPISVIEAMSAGKMIIASSFGATPEILKNGQCGILIKPNDLEDLISKIKLVINNKEIIYEYSSRARKAYIEKHTLNNFKNKLLHIFEEILSPIK